MPEMNRSFIYSFIEISVGERPRILFRKLTKLVRNFNLFPSVPPSTDENQLRNERISTRLFIILFMFLLTILALYTALVTVAKIVNIKGPDFEQYSQLSSRYSKTLTCPCAKISINYENILRVTYNFHQACTSDFVTENWTDYLSSQVGYVYNLDYRLTSRYTFQSLRTLCQSVNRTIADSLNNLYSSQYITASVTLSDLFQSQIDALVLQFISSTTNTYLLSLQMIRDTTQANALFSGPLTNYGLYIISGNPIVFTASIAYSGCDCGTKATCVQQAGIYAFATGALLYSVPGMKVGCLPIEALLQSTLECLYNRTCIDELQSYINSSAPMNPRALDSSLHSQYVANTTINDVLDQLMVERWNWSSMYESYYEECQPEECSYTYETKNDAIYIITTVIGLVGGLVTVLKLVISQIFIRALAFIQKRNRRIVPELPVITESPQCPDQWAVEDLDS